MAYVSWIRLFGPQVLQRRVVRWGFLAVFLGVGMSTLLMTVMQIREGTGAKRQPHRSETFGKPFRIV